MSKFAIACACAALAAACAHEQKPMPDQQRDWLHGLDEQQAALSPPVGPMEADVAGYETLKLREAQNALATPAGLQEIDQVLPAGSQVFASAVALPLFQAGVYQGSPELIDRACAAARRVSHAALRASGNVDAVASGCAALSSTKPSSDGCGEGAGKLRDAYGLLSAGRPADATKLGAEGVRTLRDRCPTASSPRRTPVNPTSRGFLIVWALHAAGAPPETFLAGEARPRTAEAVNDAFLRAVRAVRGPLAQAR